LNTTIDTHHSSTKGQFQGLQHHPTAWEALSLQQSGTWEMPFKDQWLWLSWTGMEESQFAFVFLSGRPGVGPLFQKCATPAGRGRGPRL